MPIILVGSSTCANWIGIGAEQDIIQFISVNIIEEGRQRHVTSYLRKRTQLIRLHRQGFLKCGCTGKTIAARAV